MCQKESWEAIFATTEAHSTQSDQPPRMHGHGLWMYEQKEQRVTPVPMIGVLWTGDLERAEAVLPDSN